ncbi:hypothetical protein BH10BDE1_BH10BDE1_25330 [soil metagenome]
MKQNVFAQPMISVNNVTKSSRWYQKLLGAKSGHGGVEYEQILSGKTMILQLHAWEIDHHHAGLMGKKSLKSRGNGTILWFLVDDFDAFEIRLKKLKPKVLKAIAINENANHREVWLQDLDGYTVVVAGHYDDI